MNNILGNLFGKNKVKAAIRDVAALVTPFAIPSVQVVRTSAHSFSHFGGSPGLPFDVEWPVKNGKKLNFLGRLSLFEISSTQPIDWLPKTGALLFFYDMEEEPWGFDPKDRGSWAVLLVPDLESQTDQYDDELKATESPLPHLNVAFRRIDTLPSNDRESVSKLEFTDGELDDYIELTEAPFVDTPKHQVSGFPAPVQGDYMELECQLVSNGLYCGDASGYEDPRATSLTPDAANWRLLLQLDSDDELGVMWGDCGTIYFWVEEHKAKVGNFSNVWLVLQCS